MGTVGVAIRKSIPEKVTLDVCSRMWGMALQLLGSES